MYYSLPRYIRNISSSLTACGTFHERSKLLCELVAILEGMTARTKRHLIGLAKLLIVIAITAVGSYRAFYVLPDPTDSSTQNIVIVGSPAGEALQTLPIKGRAPKTGYERSAFSTGWDPVQTCDVRNFILARDLTNITYVPSTCKVSGGTLLDPYTALTIEFKRGADTSDDIQIDHVVAMSDAWQKGAQQLDYISRHEFANDPLNLLAVDGNVNQQKSDSDAATWLPPNKGYRCAYVARQIAVKKKYSLWVTRSEYDAMAKILSTCPEQKLPTS